MRGVHKAMTAVRVCDPLADNMSRYPRQDRYINLLRVAGLAYDHLRSKRDIFTVQLAERPAAEMAEGTSSSRQAFATASLPPQGSSVLC